MAKSKRPQYGERGIYIYAARISFFAKASVEAWEKLISSVKMQHADKSETGDWIDASFIAFSEPLTAESLYLIGDVHSHKVEDERKGEVHWIFRWERTPSDEPPGELVTLSKAVGGYGKVLQRLEEYWPAANSIEVEFDLSVVFDRKKYSLSRRRPRSFTMKTDEGEMKIEPRMVQWQISPPCGTISRILFQYQNKRELPLIVSGTMETQISRHLFENVYETAMQDVRPFITAKSR